MRSTLEKRLEKSAKSLEEQRREKQRKLARSTFNLTEVLKQKFKKKSQIDLAQETCKVTFQSNNLRQSESSCERRRRAQKLKSDLEDGLQLWSQQVWHVEDKGFFCNQVRNMPENWHNKFKLRGGIAGAGGAGAQHAEGRESGGWNTNTLLMMVDVEEQVGGRHGQTYAPDQ